MEGSRMHARTQSLPAPGREQYAGARLAPVIRDSPRPLTALLQELSGEQLRIEVRSTGERPLQRDEPSRLRAACLTWCRYRYGLLRTADGALAASTFLLWLPARLGYETCRELDEAAEPAGVILGRLGMTRERRRAYLTRGVEEVTGVPAAVRCDAVLVVGGRPAGIAEEHVTREFAESLAG